MDDWRIRIRTAREALGLSQKHVAETAGVSAETVRGYENGRRRPTRAHLIAVLEAVELRRSDANSILESAGFAPIRKLDIPTDPASFHALAELDEVVNRCPWPAFVINEFADVVAANSTFQALVGVNLLTEFTDVTDRNLLMLASSPRFADRVENWDEAISILIGATKYNYVRPLDIEDPSPYFKRVLERFVDGDPRYVGRFAKLWDEVRPLGDRQRWEYPIVWVDPEFGRMRFKSLIYTGEDPEMLFSFNDWIPIDAESWTVLERVKARRAP